MIIAVIGGISTGKSTAIKFFVEKNMTAIKADLLAHDLLKTDSPVYKKIVDKFGQDVLNNDGKINNAILARKIFYNDQKREMLNQIIHPLVYQKISSQIDQLMGEGLKDIVIEIPLLTKENIIPRLNKIILITSPRELQIKRLEETGLAAPDIEARLRAQVSLDEQMQIADYIINNNGSSVKFSQSLENLWDILKSEWK